MGEMTEYRVVRRLDVGVVEAVGGEELTAIAFWSLCPECGKKILSHVYVNHGVAAPGSYEEEVEGED